jgi:hypothetical protein
MMIDRDKLYDDLIEMFIWYQWRLENPVPSSNDCIKHVVDHYNRNWMFNKKVKLLTAAVMEKVDNNLA